MSENILPYFWDYAENAEEMGSRVKGYDYIELASLGGVLCLIKVKDDAAIQAMVENKDSIKIFGSVAREILDRPERGIIPRIEAYLNNEPYYHTDVEAQQEKRAITQETFDEMKQCVVQLSFPIS